MAILEAVPGITVTVRINGVDCLEYDDPNVPEQQPSRPTSSKYIESLDNTEFTLCLSINKDYDWNYKGHCLVFTVRADSTWIQTHLIHKTHLTNGYFESVIKGKPTFCNKTKSWFNHALKFSEVKVVEGVTKARMEKDQQVAKNLGLVEVKVERHIYVEKDHSYCGDMSRSVSSFELAEKSLKGRSISHGTILTPGTKIPRPDFAQTKRLPGDDGPIAIFQFRYRSKKALQQELIIPRTPPGSPSLDGLSTAEINRLAKERLEEINARKQLVKKEPTSIKREVSEVYDRTDGTSARPAKTRRLTSEVIDLTDD
ncbi:hypothetical protein F5Y00DRAFT_269234 [Daldinia vernicosa]|uniref:uncharacterized protein n=1 Tax=Daldinia vernicosa TaxID=114800 RepID=UPI0020076ACC|nr:uncharacterized protein F5Y00DRAFT_269234 [Daldinia vernicosa]KAI0853864.1 hypothetical protein F5Y00DRAFT_269234 [Daldinia vernicosa]